MKRLVLLLAALVAPASTGALPDVKDGDIIFHTSRSSQSVAIQRATGSRYSHMGVIFLRAGKPTVFEAVGTVRYTPLEQWVARGQGGRFVVKRLASPLTSDQVRRLTEAAREYEGRRYDLTFEWSDTRMYCSELVWKLFQRATGIRIGALQHLREFNLSDPVVQAKMKERYGNDVPLQEPVISPSAMFSSPLLVTVGER
jgi:hypothetical protein